MSKRWTYHVVEFKFDLIRGFNPERIKEELNRQGQLGWELVNIAVPGLMQPCIAVFKKET